MALEEKKQGKKIKEIIDLLRSLSDDNTHKDDVIIIPEGCESKGFIQGYYNQAEFLHFIADMME